MKFKSQAHGVSGEGYHLIAHVIVSSQALHRVEVGEKEETKAQNDKF